MLLRYGMNPHQTPARAEPVIPGRTPLRVIRGAPSYINVLDAINAWALVREASRACGQPAATSFKHVSPAGAALAGPIDDVARETFALGPGAQPGQLTSAYLRARDADPRASYGDMIAVSEPVTHELADLLRRLPSDGIIAPGYERGTVETLAAKKNGRFLVLEADPAHQPPELEFRDVGGLRVSQPCDAAALDLASITRAANASGTRLPTQAAQDLLLGLIVLRYTQSNSIAYLREGMALGIGAGQQSRIDCTRLAGSKTDTWWLRRHPRTRALTFADEVRTSERTNWRLRFLEADLDPHEHDQVSAVLTSGDLTPLDPAEKAAWTAQLDQVSLVSDGALPFRDNVDHAARHGVRFIAEPGGSIRSRDVDIACRQHNITRIATDVPRLFHH